MKRSLAVESGVLRPLSFRDPSGFVLTDGERIWRAVEPAAWADLLRFLDSGTFRTYCEAGKLIGTRVIGEAEGPSLIHVLREEELPEGLHLVEHERVRFPTFPYEWPPEMLHAAAELTLDLAESVLGEGMVLKDATPYNILYRNCQPVFIDLLSFEKRDPLDFVWRAAGQFMRTFLLPLLLNKQFGIRLDQIFISRRDGLSPEEAEALCGRWRRFLPPFFSLVWLPAFLSQRRVARSASLYEKRRASSPQQAVFILSKTLRVLRRKLDAVRPTENKRSTWFEYVRYHDGDYTADKIRLVANFISFHRPRDVLDAGCNTGTFSLLAARSGSQVIAIDSDPAVVGVVWRRARDEDRSVLPLVIDISRPSPAIGWRNRECASFESRAHGAFDLVMMLAILHHMLVTERIPLNEIVNFAAALTSRFAVLEFVPPEDPLFRQMARGREDLFVHLTRDSFERCCACRFELLDKKRLGRTDRWLYFLRKK
ncbi:MAG: SAM-dependent methyltransferase [Pyrinomonas sp.]